MEESKDIKGFEGLYSISDIGEITSKRTGNKMKLSKGGSGHLRVGLRKNSKTKYFKVHRLVAEHFVENPNNFTWVKTIKEKDNPSANNLKWVESPKDREMPIDKLIEYYNSLDRSEWRIDQVQLFEYIKTKDGEHLSEIYEKLYNIWLGWLLKLTECMDVATGILHESYEAFTDSLISGRYRIDRATVKHSVDIYIKRLVRNACTNWKRKNKKLVFVAEYWDNSMEY